MRETVTSLRVYFILSGGSSLVFAVSALDKIPGPGTVAKVLLTVSVVFGLAFLYVGAFLGRLLLTASDRIVALLYASFGWSIFAFLLGLMLRGFSESGLVILMISWLVVWYLLRNARRLAAEALVSSYQPPL